MALEIKAAAEIDTGKDAEHSDSPLFGGEQQPKRNSIVRRPKGTTNAGATLSTSAYTYIDLGGPATGKTWDVTNILVRKADPSAASVTKLCAVFVTASPAAPSSFDCEAIGAAIPTQFTWGKGAMVLQDSEHLVIGVIANASGDQYVASARANELDADDLPEGLKH